MGEMPAGWTEDKFDQGDGDGLSADRAEQLYAEVLEDWEKDGYPHAVTFFDLLDISEKLEVMLEHGDELMRLFSDAGEAIRRVAAAEGESRRLLLLKSYLGIAGNASEKYDYEATDTYLMKIIAESEKTPEA